MKSLEIFFSQEAEVYGSLSAVGCEIIVDPFKSAFSTSAASPWTQFRALRPRLWVHERKNPFTHISDPVSYILLE